MKRRSIIGMSAAALLGMSVLTGGAVGQQGSLKDQLLGTWTLVSHEAVRELPHFVDSQVDPPPGCPFNPRCPFANAHCHVEIPLPIQAGAAIVRCHAVQEGRL